MAEKKGAGGEPQTFDTETGQYGGEAGNNSADGNNSYDSRDDFKQVVDRATGKVLSTVSVPTAVKFNRLNTKNHIRHAKELGYKDQAEYEKAAADFFSSTRGKLYIDLRLKKFYRYEEKTRLLAVVDGDGGICTFCRAESKTYFDRKMKQEGLYEIK